MIDICEHKPSDSRINPGLKPWQQVDDWQAAIWLMCRFLRGEDPSVTPWHHGPLHKNSKPLINTLIELHEHGILTIASQPHDDRIKHSSASRGKWKQTQRRGYVSFVLPYEHSKLPVVRIEKFIKALKESPSLEILACRSLNGTGYIECMKPRESSTVLLRTRRAVAEGTLKKAAYRSKKELTMDERTADLALRLLRKDMNLRYTGFYHVFAYVREWEAGSAFLENIVQVLEECGLSKRFSVDQSREPRRNTTHELSMMYVYLTQSTPNTQNLNSTDMPTPILFTSQKEYEIGAIPDEKEFEFNNQHKISLRAEFDVEKDYMSYISVHRHKIHVSDDESSLIRRIESHETIYSCRECASHAIHEIDCFVLPADQGPTVMSASDEYPKRMKICIDGQGQDWPLSEMDQQDPFHELSWDLISNPSQARWGLESSRGMPFDSSPNRTERSLFEQPTILTLEVGRYGLECHEIEVQGTVREVLQRVHEYYDHEMPFDHCDCEPNELRNHRCMGDLFFEGIRDNQVLFGT